MKTLVLANQKGGVGKSAVATLLSHYLAHGPAHPATRTAGPAVADSETHLAPQQAAH